MEADCLVVPSFLELADFGGDAITIARFPAAVYIKSLIVALVT